MSEAPHPDPTDSEPVRSHSPRGFPPQGGSLIQPQRGGDHGRSAPRSMALDHGMAFAPAGFGGGFGAHDDFAGPPPSGRRSFSPRDLLIQAFYNKRLIRNCIGAGVVVGLLATALSHTQYTADSLLLLLQGPDAGAVGDLSGLPSGAPPVDGVKIVQSEVQLIQSDNVVRQAVEHAGIETLFPSLAHRRLLGILPPAGPLQQEAEAVKRFKADLRVDNEAGTNVIRVSYTSPDRDVSVRAVQALVGAYMDQRRAVYSSTATSYLGQEITRYAAQLKTLESRIQKTRDTYGVLDIAQDITLATNRLDGVTQRENQVRERQTAVHAEMLAAQQRLGSMPKQVFDSREVTNNAANDDARNTLLKLEQDRQHMATQYSSNWPGVRELDSKIAAVRSQIADNSHGRFFTARSVRNPVVDQISSRLASLQIEDQSLGQQLTELGDQYKQAAKRVDDLRVADNKLHDLQRSRDVTENIYRQLSLREAGAQVREGAADRSAASLRVVQPASAPLTGHSMGPTLMSGGVMLGLVLALAASVIATLLRQVYIMPSEAERDLDLPALADFNVSASDFTSRAGRQEVGNLAAFLLDVTVDGRPLSVVQIASSGDANDGKPELVRALATELAQGHGLRTLILDLQGDGRAEALALGGSAERNVSVLETDMPVVATGVPQLWVSVDAARSSLGNARTLVSRSRELLDGLRQRFDMVLIISPPDMSDYAARRLSALVDANLLVIRSEHTRAPVATQMRDVILSAGGNLLGFAYTWRRYHIPAAIYRWL